MLSLKTIKHNYQIPEELFADIIETIEIALYYDLTQSKVLEYTLENCPIKNYSISYQLFSEATAEIITYINQQHLLNYTELNEYMAVLCEIYQFYTVNA